MTVGSSSTAFTADRVALRMGSVIGNSAIRYLYFDKGKKKQKIVKLFGLGLGLDVSKNLAYSIFVVSLFKLPLTQAIDCC